MKCNNKLPDPISAFRSGNRKRQWETEREGDAAAKESRHKAKRRRVKVQFEYLAGRGGATQRKTPAD